MDNTSESPKKGVMTSPGSPLTPQHGDRSAPAKATFLASTRAATQHADLRFLALDEESRVLRESEYHDRTSRSIPHQLSLFPDLKEPTEDDEPYHDARLVARSVGGERQSPLSKALVDQANHQFPRRFEYVPRELCLRPKPRKHKEGTDILFDETR